MHSTLTAMTSNPPRQGKLPLPYNPAVRQTRRRSPRADRIPPLDFLPTQPWAVRAIAEQVIGLDELAGAMVLDPAAGGGDLLWALEGLAGSLRAADVADYGIVGVDRHAVPVRNFLTWRPQASERPDLVFTNPPFAAAEAFIDAALAIATRGVVMITRLSFVEGQGRYARLFSKRPPSTIAVFAERVPMFAGRLDPQGRTATSYAVAYWRVGEHQIGAGAGRTTFQWIAPCRARLERPEDYHGWRWREIGGLVLPPRLTLRAADLEGFPLGPPLVDVLAHRLTIPLSRLRPFSEVTTGGVHPTRVVASLVEEVAGCGRASHRRVLARINLAHGCPDHAEQIHDALVAAVEWHRRQRAAGIATDRR